MSSLSDKLRALGVKIDQEQPTRPSAPEYPVEQVLAGHLEETPYGLAFLAEQRYPVDRQHGCSSLRIAAPMDTMGQWVGDPRMVDIGGDDLGYLDAETTGLARGTGTYAFLIGAARYDGGAFQLAQFFMRDPAEEPAMLAALIKFLAPCKALITFNGKTFDLPLLHARYIANGQAYPFAAIPHLDLLFLARRLWHTRLPSRSMSCLEQQVLGVRRAGADVPGWMIPELYFQYLSDGDARPLQGVFYHNEIDVLSMAALFSHAAALLADPAARQDVHAQDLVDVARLFEDLGRLETAAQLYERALASDLPPQVREQALQQWSFMEKRRDGIPVAARLWREAAAMGAIYAHIELAKVYEHRERDLQEALHWTEAAIELISAPDCPRHERDQWAGELNHRLARLRRRLSGADEQDTGTDSDVCG